MVKDISQVFYAYDSCQNCLTTETLPTETLKGRIFQAMSAKHRLEITFIKIGTEK